MVFRRVTLPNKFFCDIGAFNFYFNYFIFNLLDFTLAYTYMIHICFCLFWWWALFAAFRCASLRCFEAQGQCSRRVVVACGHLTQWAVGTVGWLTAVRGLGGVIDVGTFASATAPTRCRETPSPRRPLVTAIGRYAARLAYLSAHPPSE